jgi:thioredoxin-like negative regulator of GroEL
VNGLAQELRGDVYIHFIDIDNLGNRNLVTEYNVSSIPLIVILNDNGEISTTFRGLTPEAVLRDALNTALQESAADQRTT